MTSAPVPKLTRLSVEVGLTEHCNIKCHACAHASPLLPEKFASLAGFVRDIEALSAAFHASELRLVGGEPLLHPDLPAFIAEGRRAGIADHVVVYTNGVLLHQMPVAFWQSIDGLRISAYPGVRRRLDDDECARLCRDNGVELTIKPFPSFEQTLLGRRIGDRPLVKAIYRACNTARICHTIHDGRFYKCPMATLMKPWLALHGIPFESPPGDGVALHGNASLREHLEAYLDDPAPLAACDYCLGSSGPAVRHRQLDRTGCAAWLAEDAQPLIDDVRTRLLGRGLRAAVRRVRSMLAERA